MWGQFVKNCGTRSTYIKASTGPYICEILGATWYKIGQ